MQKMIKNNKTINLSRAIIMLTKNGTEREEKVLVSKIENACYELIDTTHNNENKVESVLGYLYDLFTIAKQTNLFKDENTLFIINAIKNILADYETKIKDNTDVSLTEKIKDILSQNTMNNVLSSGTRETKNTENKETGYLPFNIKRTEIKDVEKIKNEGSNFLKISETKNEIKKTDFNQSNRHVENNNRKLSRRDEVLKILSSVPVSIKDVSDKVLGCSEKTLQRELNALVDTRQAIRIGEKRWSRYVLA